MSKEEFLKQIEALRKAYGAIRYIDPESANYKKLKALVESMDNDLVAIVRDAQIKFMSNIAWRVCNSRGIK